MAIGTSPNRLIRSTTPGLDTNKRGCIVADEETGLTSKDGVFAGGDAVTGAATVILAMGAGKRAAAAMHEYIQRRTAKLQIVLSNLSKSKRNYDFLPVQSLCTGILS